MRQSLLFFLLLLPWVLTAQPIKSYDLKPVTINSSKVADTAFGTWKFSVADFEFYGDRMVLLTYQRSLNHAKVMLTDGGNTIQSSVDIPDVAQELYKDYQGYINVICDEHIYRLLFRSDGLHLGSLPVDDFRSYIMPCLDTLDRNIYFSNYSKDYPEFTYYSYQPSDSALIAMRTVTDQEQLRSYNMEYYFLPVHERFAASRMAREYGVDKHRIAAMMSGVTTSMYYTPLYAPLFVIRDTICVFDHYSNAIFKYDSRHHLLDSIPIQYHHPKNWREWKHRILVDEVTGDAYALYQKAGHYQLNHLNLSTGKITDSYTLLNPYVDRLKIRNGYAYYVYSPFETMQEFFVYRELISN